MSSLTKVAGVSSRGRVGGGFGAVLAGVSGGEIPSGAVSEEGGAFSLRKVRLNLNPRSSSLLLLPAQILWKCESCRPGLITRIELLIKSL